METTTNETVNLTQAKRPRGALRSVGNLVSVTAGALTGVVESTASKLPTLADQSLNLVIDTFTIAGNTLLVSAIESERDKVEDKAELFNWSKEAKEQAIKAIEIKYANR